MAFPDPSLSNSSGKDFFNHFLLQHRQAFCWLKFDEPVESYYLRRGNDQTRIKNVYGTQCKFFSKNNIVEKN
jgi:hypothetical protein